MKNILRTLSGKFNEPVSPIEELAEPQFPADVDSCLVKLYKPSWTDEGYQEDVPGYIWYYTGGASNGSDRRIAYGDNVLGAAREFDERIHGKASKAVRVSHFGHRYAKQKESAKDRISYHTGVFIEWDHGEYGTVVVPFNFHHCISFS